jgi:hypothetical protein
MVQPHDRLSRALMCAPLVFVAHFLEESPGFVPWFNAHVTRGITAELFWTVNATASARVYSSRPPCSERSRWRCTGTGSCFSVPACSRRRRIHA